MSKFEATALADSFGGQLKNVWLSVEDFRAFIRELEIFERMRHGEVSLAALGDGSDYCPFRLRLFSLNRLGHVGASAEIVQSSYIGSNGVLAANRVNVTFEAEPSSLPRFLLESQRLIDSLGL